MLVLLHLHFTYHLAGKFFNIALFRVIFKLCLFIQYSHFNNSNENLLLFNTKSSFLYGVITNIFSFIHAKIFKFYSALFLALFVVTFLLFSLLTLLP